MRDGLDHFLRGGGGGGGGGWARRYSEVYVVTLTAQHSADKQWLCVVGHDVTCLQVRVPL